MLKTRIIPTLLFKDVGLVKGTAFESSRRVGPALQAIRVYSIREVDELIFLDITATPNRRGPDLDQIDVLADECQMPLTVGGGVRSVRDIRELLSVGADKVAINSAAIKDKSIIKEGAEFFGSQCIVASIDFRRGSDGRAEVYSECGHVPEGLCPLEWAKELECLGAGEILLTSVCRDGTMDGYDIDMTRQVSDAVSIPVIASGGAGNYKHMEDVLLEGHASAVAAASIFHFTEQTPHEAKLYLETKGIPVRLNYGP